DLAAVEVYERLEERHELAGLDAAANFLLQLEPVADLALELLIEPGKAVSSGALGSIERDVALAERSFVVVAAGQVRQSDRGGHQDLRAFDCRRNGHALDDPLRDGLCLDRACPGEKNCEFIASGARAARVRGRGLTRDVRDEPEHLVAREVSVKVIDSFEMIEVEDQEDAAAHP